MNIKELEKSLCISRANIRFYEKEGLISPKRTESNYRDYSHEDEEKLKKVLIFRKLNFSIQDIKSMQLDELELSHAIDTNIEKTKAEIDELNGAIEIATKMKLENPTFQNINVELYWDLINKKQQKGSGFFNTDNDYLLYELNLFDEMMKRVFFYDFKDSRKKHGIWIAVLIIILVFIVRGLANEFLWQKSFFEGMFYPLIIFAVCSIIMLPIYILSKRKPKTAGIVATVICIAGIAFLLIIVALIVVSVFKSFIR